MSLYLCVFEGDEEVAGVEAGPYADFNALRDYVVRELEGGVAGSRFPTLILHSDCDGEWPAGACAPLRDELTTVFEALQGLPPLDYPSDWQRALARSLGLRPRHAADCFLDVDGQPLVARLRELADVARERRRPILFQ